MEYVMSFLQLAISLAYVVLGLRWVPQLRLPGWASMCGWAFFLTCALTHLDLAIHTVTATDAAFLTSFHMFVIHGAQAAFDWAFIAATLAFSIELNMTRRGRRRAPETIPVDRITAD